METPVLVAVALLAAAGGAVLGLLVPQHVGIPGDEGGQVRGRRIEAEARTQQKELILEAKDEKLRLAARGRGRGPRASAASSPTSSAGCSSATSSSTSAPTCSSSATASSSSASASSTRPARSSPARTQEQVAALERVAGLSAEDAKGVLLEAVREEAEHDAVKLARAIERKPLARRPRTRRATSSSPPSSASPPTTPPSTPSRSCHLPSRRDEGPHHRPRGPQHPRPRAGHRRRPDHRRHARDGHPLAASTRSAARSPGSPSPSSSQDGRIHPGRIEEVVAKARAEVDLVIRQAGEQAAYEAGVPGPARRDHQAPRPAQVPHQLRPERAQPLVETSRLAAVIAAEIGADVQIAKMGGLLHDIGKAVDHEVEGPHAAIGAADRPAPQPAVQGRQRHRRPPPGGRVRLRRGADRPGRRRDQRVTPGRPRRVDGHVRQAPRGPAGDRRRASPASRVVRRPGRPRGAHPRPARGDRRPRRRRAWRATSSRRSRRR